MPKAVKVDKTLLDKARKAAAQNGGSKTTTIKVRRFTKECLTQLAEWNESMDHVICGIAGIPHEEDEKK